MHFYSESECDKFENFREKNSRKISACRLHSTPVRRGLTLTSLGMSSKVCRRCSKVVWCFHFFNIFISAHRCFHRSSNAFKFLCSTSINFIYRDKRSDSASAIPFQGRSRCELIYSTDISGWIKVEWRSAVVCYLKKNAILIRRPLSLGSYAVWEDLTTFWN